MDVHSLPALRIPQKEIPLYYRGDSGGSGGIRTHVPFRTTAFRVRLVTTTSIRFHSPTIIKQPLRKSQAKSGTVRDLTFPSQRVNPGTRRNSREQHAVCEKWMLFCYAFANLLLCLPVKTIIETDITDTGGHYGKQALCFPVSGRLAQPGHG